jgi:ATP-dependent RNA helicase DeaD
VKFSEFNFNKDIEKGLKIAGFKEPSPIQEEAIPLVLDGIDIVAQAHTGT